MSLVVVGSVAYDGVETPHGTVPRMLGGAATYIALASSYFTKTNKSGAFRLQNIKAGRYKIYAFDDKNKNLKVESRSEMYAFINQHLTLRKSTDTISLQMVTLDSRPLKLSSIRNMGTVTRLRFSKFLSDYSIKSPKEVVHAFGDNQTEINEYIVQNRVPEEIVHPLLTHLTPQTQRSPAR